MKEQSNDFVDYCVHTYIHTCICTCSMNDIEKEFANQVSTSEFIIGTKFIDGMNKIIIINIIKTKNKILKLYPYSLVRRFCCMLARDTCLKTSR